MIYERIFSKAWDFTWKYKSLWVLGFLASLFWGNNNINSNFVQGSAWLFQNIGGMINPDALITTLTIIISIGLWLIGTVARISLIREVAALDVKRPRPIAPLKDVFQAAFKSLRSVLLMQLLLWWPIIILNLIMVIASRSLTQSLDANIVGGTIPMGATSAFTGIWLLGMSTAILAVPLIYMDAFAYRAIVLEQRGVKASLQKAAHILRTHTKSILTFSAICLLIGLIFSFVIGIILMPLIPLVMFAMEPLLQVMQQCTANVNINAVMSCMQRLSTSPLFIVVGLIMSSLNAALSAVWVVFQSAIFTLAYKKLTEISKPR